MSALRPPYTVQELTREIQAHLEGSYDWVQVKGEISGFKKAASGHAYFALKDKDAVLNCVAWKSTVIRWAGLDLRDGMEVTAGGNVSLYPARGQLQMVVSSLRLAGVGQLQIRFDILKQQLMDEGLFDQEQKKSIPRFPKRVAVITSATGAAVHDFIRTLQTYSTPIDVTVCPVPVQGEQAAPAIVSMLNAVDTSQRFDVIVLCRGGGSLEDLWAFNEESVARAIAASATPVLTGIGHEVDFTIADGVADMRASTPTAAATVLAGIWSTHRERLHTLEDQLLRCVVPQVKAECERVRTLQRDLKRIHPRSMLTRERLRLDELATRMQSHLAQRLRLERTTLAGQHHTLAINGQHSLTEQQNRLRHVHALLHSYDPHHTLTRGYAICRDENGNPIQQVNNTAPGKSIQVELMDGRLHSVIQGIERTNEKKEN